MCTFGWDLREFNQKKGFARFEKGSAQLFLRCSRAKAKVRKRPFSSNNKSHFGIFHFYFWKKKTFDDAPTLFIAYKLMDWIGCGWYPSHFWIFVLIIYFTSQKANEYNIVLCLWYWTLRFFLCVEFNTHISQNINKSLISLANVVLW